jgi:hypothetical protein
MHGRLPRNPARTPLYPFIGSAVKAALALQMQIHV